MRITISGPPGSGKTTACRNLSERLGLESVVFGQIFRQMAADRGMSLVEFGALAEQDPSIDRLIDTRILEIAREKEDIILEREIETNTIRQLLSLGGGTASLNEILLPENFKYAGQPIKDVPMPGDSILVSITRDTEFIIPHGNTVLLPWDRILCLTQDDTLHLLTEEWGLNNL